MAVGPDGTAYAGSESSVKAYNPDGTLKWTFNQNPIALFFVGLSVGPDGNIYGVSTSGIGAFSITPAGTLRWAVPEPYDARNPVIYGEIVFGPSGGKTQTNSHVRAFGLDGKLAFTIDIAAQPVIGPEGNIHVPYGAYSPIDGRLAWVFSSPYPYNVSDTQLWRVNLPAENGFNQRSDTRARFTPDGLTAYMMTFTATGDNDTSASFLYALDTASTTGQQTLKSTKITIKAVNAGSSANATGKVTVQDSISAPVAGATVAVTWTLPSGQTLAQTVATTSRGLAAFGVTDIPGIYTLTVANITKSGYTFDAANSVLTKSVRSR